MAINGSNVSVNSDCRGLKCAETVHKFQEVFFEAMPINLLSLYIITI